MAEILSTDDVFAWSISKIARAFKVSRDTVSRRINALGVQPAGKRLGHAVYELTDVARLVSEREEIPFDPEKMQPKDRRDW
jgi:hypothetical protein